MDKTALLAAADATATSLGIEATAPAATPAPAAAAPPVQSEAPPAPPEAPPAAPPAATGAPSPAFTADDVRKAIAEGKLTAADLADVVNPKLQSSVGRLQNLGKIVSANVAKVAETVGVKLPEGKAGYELLADEEGTKQFFDAIRETVRAEVMAPAVTAGDLERAKGEVISALQNTVEVYPEFTPHLKEIGVALNSDETLQEFAQNPKAVPYILSLLGHTILSEKYKTERDSAVTERDRLGKALKDAQDAFQHGKETSRAASTPTPPANSSGTGATLREIANGVFDKATAGVN
jgi:hypothetical protein